MSEVAAIPPVWVVTGMSGAGKASVLRSLERAGVGCIDNLPAELVAAVAASATGPTAIVVDARRGGAALLDWVPPTGVRVLFLDARDEVLVRRQAESIRPHPCAGSGNGAAAVAAERAALVALRASADVVLDSSELSSDQLGSRAVEVVAPDQQPAGLVCTVSSFGFKYGGQPEADWVVDARFLRNPFWEPQLRPLSGLDREVQDYVLGQPMTVEFLARLGDLIGWTAARAQAHGRTRLHVAIGCTGGRHRSVVVAEALAQRLRADGVTVAVRHRDIERPAEPGVAG